MRQSVSSAESQAFGRSHKKMSTWHGEADSLNRRPHFFLQWIPPLLLRGNGDEEGVERCLFSKQVALLLARYSVLIGCSSFAIIVGLYSRLETPACYREGYITCASFSVRAGKTASELRFRGFVDIAIKLESQCVDLPFFTWSERSIALKASRLPVPA